MFVAHFVGGRWVFRGCSLCISWVFATHSQSVQNTFTECSQRVHSLYVTSSPCKSMVFAPQKYGFWRAKTPFLHCKNPLFEIPKWGSEFRAYTAIQKHRMFFAATQMGGGYVKKMVR